MASTRRFAAILAADVAGYSRLMGADEEGTHERVQAHFRELVGPKIGEHSGRVVKNTGDGMLAEFPSVVDAVRCAVELQRAMIDREAGTPEERRIRFRIGINLGDVIVEDDDIFGDGVNVAARLEALAEPGGICISRMVRDQIRDKLPYAFEDLGEQSVKNIARPVRVYALRAEALAPAPPAPATPPISQSVAPRLSIVVLPFTNLSNDPEQEYFADGITEDLTTDLSRIADMVVISRNTAFTYQGKRVDTKRIGRELNVRYVLEGSVRRSSNQIRINAQLIDAATDAHLWAERFDGDMGDLFALQNEVTSRIANALRVELIVAEAARPIENPVALDCVLRGRAASEKPRSREAVAEAIEWFERALALDRHSVEAQIHLAVVLVSRPLNGISDWAAADLARADGLVDQALATSPRSALAHVVRGQVLRGQGRPEEAILAYETALALDHNSVTALNGLAWCKLYTGLMNEAISFAEKAIHLSPCDPVVGDRYFVIGQAHLLQSHIDEAIMWLERSVNARPRLPLNRGWLTAAYALKGDTQRAAAALAEARRLASEGFFSSIARRRLEWSSGVGRGARPEIHALFETTYFAGLRKAGVPEE